MIIEDDRSQALFAESILRKAGMETIAVMDPLSALEALDSFDPELILMDLYMPNCDGMELTTLIPRA
jgi:CheY-like chemotaxis protein